MQIDIRFAKFFWFVMSFVLMAASANAYMSIHLIQEWSEIVPHGYAVVIAVVVTGVLTFFSTMIAVWIVETCLLRCPSNEELATRSWQ